MLSYLTKQSSTDVHINRKLTKLIVSEYYGLVEVVVVMLLTERSKLLTYKSFHIMFIIINVAY